MTDGAAGAVIRDARRHPAPPSNFHAPRPTAPSAPPPAHCASSAGFCVATTTPILNARLLHQRHDRPLGRRVAGCGGEDPYTAEAWGRLRRGRYEAPVGESVASASTLGSGARLGERRASTARSTASQRTRPPPNRRQPRFLELDPLQTAVSRDSWNSTPSGVAVSGDFWNSIPSGVAASGDSWNSSPTMARDGVAADDHRANLKDCEREQQIEKGGAQLHRDPRRDLCSETTPARACPAPSPSTGFGCLYPPVEDLADHAHLQGRLSSRRRAASSGTKGRRARSSPARERRSPLKKRRSPR